MENGQFHDKASKDCIPFVNKKPPFRIFHLYKAYFVHKRDSQITRAKDCQGYNAKWKFTDNAKFHSLNEPINPHDSKNIRIIK